MGRASKAARQQYIAAQPGHPTGVFAKLFNVNERTIERDRKDLGLPNAWVTRLPEYYTHGVTGYQRGCRCDSCVDAGRKTMAEQRASRIARGLAPGDPRHGTETGYGNWRCRCDSCKRAWSIRNRRARAKGLNHA